MVWTTPPNFTDGQVVTETQLDILSNDLLDLHARTQLVEGTVGRGIIVRGRRGTPSSASSGAVVGVMRITGIPVFANRTYSIRTNNLGLFSNVANDIVSAEIRYTTTGANATTSSAILPGCAATGIVANATHGDFRPIMGLYRPVTDHSLSLILCVVRKAGTGTATIYADVDTGGNYTTDLWVEDLGPAINSTGTNL